MSQPVRDHEQASTRRRRRLTAVVVALATTAVAGLGLAVSTRSSAHTPASTASAGTSNETTPASLSGYRAASTKEPRHVGLRTSDAGREGPASSEIEVNGCGAASGISRYIIPNNPLGFPFEGPCNHHDYCYGAGADKTFCDNQFYADLQEVCQGNVVCDALAWIYWKAVSWFGQSAYDASSQARLDALINNIVACGSDDACVTNAVDQANFDNLVQQLQACQGNSECEADVRRRFDGDPPEPPTTEPPATEPPATEPPATEPPATEPPVSPPSEPGDPAPDPGNPGGGDPGASDPGGGDYGGGDYGGGDYGGGDYGGGDYGGGGGGGGCVAAFAAKTTPATKAPHAALLYEC
jgi:uncharacterized membrane protein YgcG